MDPLSVSASIAGLLAAAAAVTGMLHKVARAPKFAESVHFEVIDIKVCLRQLQSFINATTIASQSQKSLIMVEDLVVILTRCVTIFLNLKRVLGSLKADLLTSTMEKVRWVLKQRSILKILSQL